MISKKVITADGTTQRFLSDFIIRSEQYARTYVYVYDVTVPSAILEDGTTDQANWSYPDNLWIRPMDNPESSDLVGLQYWDLVDNSILFYNVPQQPVSSGATRVWIEVATTSEEFGDTLTQPALDRAIEAAELSQAWADGIEPGGTGTQSSKVWANASETSSSSSADSAAEAANSAAEAANSALLTVGRITTVDSISDLLLVDYTLYPDVNVLGYTTINDGGGGLFNYDATQSAINNGGTILNGWVRQYNDTVNVKWFGAKGDGTTDDTTAVQLAVTNNTNIDCIDGNFVLTTISITSDTTFNCSNCTFKRKDDTDKEQPEGNSYWDTGSAIFEVDLVGITVVFNGNFTHDGNNSNQGTIEPTGFFLKTYPTVTIDGNDTVIKINNGTFINGTSGYLLLRGDDIQKRYETKIEVNSCKFYDTIYGKGKGDPSTPTALGYSPNYVIVYDYVRLNTYNFNAEWSKPTGTGEYAAVAINATFYGVSYATSGNSNINLFGTTYIRGLGRSAKSYDDVDWINSNGIGAIDCYGNSDTLFVEKLVAYDTENVALRAKASLANYTVLDANLTDCHRGLQISPSSTGGAETIVYIGNLVSNGGTIPQLEITGTLTTDLIPSATVLSANLVGPFTDPEGISGIDQGVTRIRNVDKLSINNINISNSAVTVPLTVNYVVNADLTSIIIDSSPAEGAFFQACGVINLSEFSISDSLSSALSLGTGNAKITLNNGSILNAVNYGVFINTGVETETVIDSIGVDTVTGSSRAFYQGHGSISVSNSSSVNATTTLHKISGVKINENYNSWNPNVEEGSLYLTTIGIHTRGDIMWNPLPTAGGTVGWICITGDDTDAGIWKEFGTIAT